MEYQVLARKWRPKTFEDVIGQKHITNSLQNAISQNKIGHAYLLSGTRGIGKTSVARLFAKALRCEQRIEGENSCGVCLCCLDFDSGASMNVLEIDGASNNTVDSVRDLINNVHYLPTTGKYKIYIIDEVHMLSQQAFNALLKTLEEPPEHVIFIFATTIPEKLLGTVLSRCQRFDFRNASQIDLVAHLKKIAQAEEIKVSNDKIYQQIAKMAAGSVRDSLSLMDQVLSFAPENNITEEILAKSLGLARTSSISSLVKGLLVGDVKAVSNNYREMIFENILLKSIVHSVLDFLFDAIENIDDETYLENELELSPALLSNVSTPELMWIFENIGKESGWILESIDPAKIFEVQLQKITMRREIINFEYGVSSSQTEKKKSPIVPTEIEEKPTLQNLQDEIEKGRSEATAELLNQENLESQESVGNDGTADSEIHDVQIATTWEEALTILKLKSKATGSYLERSNLLSPIEINATRAIINLGVPQHEKIIYDHLQADESKSKVTKLLTEVFQKEITFNVTLLEQEEIDRTQFKTKVELIEEEEDKKLQEQEEGLKNNDMVRKAEQLFNTKVDKIILNKQIK